LLKNKTRLTQFFKRAHYNFSVKKNSNFTICLLGRPNVGKSTLINALSGERVSLVDNTPGLTRDRKESVVKLFDIKVKLVDTAGVEQLEEENSNKDAITKESISQTRKALVLADLGLFMIDARAGVTTADINLAHWINQRRNYNKKMNELEQQLEKVSSKEENLTSEEKEELYESYRKMKLSKDVTIPPIRLIINKAENNFRGNGIETDYIKLNLGDPIYISAEHGDNMVNKILIKA
jgi:small GTP-binding protein